MAVIKNEDFDISKIEIGVPKSHRFIDLTGQKFGKLEVVAYAGLIKRKARWLCRCDCGNWSTNVRSCDLIAKVTKSCGCISQQQLNARTTHGMSRTRVHRIWQGMQQRCFNPKGSGYNRYGGRGITVCDRWRIFENFYEDMGEPLPHQSIDRIDSNGNYEPENCRWATNAEQTRNMGSNNWFTIKDRTQCLTDWCSEYGIKMTTVLGRLDRGWEVEKAFSTPAVPTRDYRKDKGRKSVPPNTFVETIPIVESTIYQ